MATHSNDMMSQPGDTDLTSPRPLSQLWQMPVLVGGVLMMTVGLYLVMTSDGDNDDFSGALNLIQTYLDTNELEEADHKLAQIRQQIDRASQLEQGRHELLWGDLIYLQERVQGWNQPENHQQVLSHYGKAKQLGHFFDNEHQSRWAETLMALGRDQETFSFIDQMNDQPARSRYLLIKRLVQRERRSGHDTDLQRLDPMLDRFADELRQETDQVRHRVETIWSTVQRAEMLLDSGNPDHGISILQRRIMLFKNEGGDDDLAPLWILLAKGYLKNGDFEESRQYYKLAQTRLLDSDPLNGQVLVGLAETELAEDGDVQQALAHYIQAERDWPETGSYLVALVGRADCEAKLGYHHQAIKHFGMAVHNLLGNSQSTDLRSHLLSNVVYSHYDKHFAQHNYEWALDYLSLIAPLHGRQIAADLLLKMAVVHQHMAENPLSSAIPDGNKSASTIDESNLSVITMEKENLKAAGHFLRAAEYFVQHAQAVARDDDELYGDSLWEAAACFGRAQMWKEAVDVYAQLVTTRAADSRQIKAVRHLGLAYMADRRYRAALDLFVQLIDEFPRSPEAYASLVPLARCHIELNQLDNATRTLKHVIDDHPAITPGSVHYREALIEIGKLHQRRGEMEAAIERLDEALERYSDQKEAGSLCFLLADAYRRSASQIQLDLEQQVLSRTRRQALQAQRVTCLAKAQELFEQAIRQLAVREPHGLSATETLYLRNAYFYRADCAYDLGSYQASITLYDQAARGWEKDPATLVALVQIVNAYCELGLDQEARAANRRARAHLKLIPEEAFDDPSVPMTRRHWQDWLRWTSELGWFDEPQVRAATTPQ